KRANQVLSGFEVDTGFAADGRVELRLYRRRNLNELHAAHVHRGQHSADITDYAAAEGDDDRLAIRPTLDQFFRQKFKSRKTLVAFAVSHLYQLGGKSRGDKRFKQDFSPSAAHGRNREDKQRFDSAQQVANHSSCASQRAVLNYGLVQALLSF